MILIIKNIILITFKLVAGLHRGLRDRGSADPFHLRTAGAFQHVAAIHLSLILAPSRAVLSPKVLVIRVKSIERLVFSMIFMSFQLPTMRFLGDLGAFPHA